MMRTSTGSMRVTKIIQKKKLRSGKRKNTMANEAMIEIAILPKAMASAMTRLLNIIGPTGAATPLVGAGREHLRIVFPELIAGQERHRNLENVVQRVRRGDERDIERKGDDQDAGDEHGVREHGQAGPAFYHHPSTAPCAR